MNRSAEQGSVLEEAAELLYRYGRASDELDTATLARLALPDITYMGPDEELQGVTQWLTVFDRLKSSGATYLIHLITNPLVTMRPDEAVEVTALYQATVFFPDETRIVYGKYHNVLRRDDDGQLKFSVLRPSADRVLTLSGAPATTASRPMARERD